MNPNSKFRMMFGALILAFGSCGAFATEEIVDDEDSANYLAAHIAASSGGSMDQYLLYSRKLAQTLDQLDLAAQQRVFDPENASGGGESNLNSGEGDSGGTGGEGDSSWWDRFWDWLKGLFS
ncbi:MAG: hypothetical protein AAF585_26900 [Verrucomicrobiota bacterium]